VRILILYCEEGEGHASVARTLAHELDAVGAETVVHDALQDGLGRLIPFCTRDAYRVQVRWLRWTYGLEYLVFTRFPPTRTIARLGLSLLGGRPLRRLIKRVAPTVIVSTHPAVTNVLGALRRRGHLDVPVVATVTDFGVHSLWAHRGVDLHLVMHERSVPRVERVAGAGSARVVDAIVAADFRSSVSQAEARRALGLPAVGAIALVSGGGWAVGRLEAALLAAMQVPGLFTVVLTGRNDVLRRRLERRIDSAQRVRVVPFTDRMPELLAAVDVLIDSTLGVTCLEALSAGCRVIAFGAPPGHSRDNARALAALGLAERPRTAGELTELLSNLAQQRARMPRLLAQAERSADAILTARERVQAKKSRRAAYVAGAATAATMAFTGWTFGSPTPYPIVARAFDLGGLQQVDTARPEAGLVVDAPQPQIVRLARLLAERHEHASFVVSTPPSAALVDALGSLRDGLLPATSSGGPMALLRFRNHLVVLAKGLGARGRFYYLRPRSGFTLADYLAARQAGGLPVTASVTLDGTGMPELDDVHPGAIVFVEAGSGQARDSLTTALALLESRDLRAVSLAELVASTARARTIGVERASASAPPPTSASAATSPRSRHADDDHHSRAITGASATGTNVVSAKTSGATCATGRL
jgi:processive 1,2-diacylglycerol beta-glucosyltransferase